MPTWSWLPLLALLLVAATAADDSVDNVLPQRGCGGVGFPPYPFGIGHAGFQIACMNNGSAGEMPVLVGTNKRIQKPLLPAVIKLSVVVQVLNLTVAPLPIALQCLNATGQRTGGIDFNKDGVYRVSFKDGRTTAGRFNYKLYAFVVEKGSYNDLRLDCDGGNSSVSCAVGANKPAAGHDEYAQACRSNHSECVVDSTNGPGYFCCNCSKGYEGNPYVVGGCIRITIGTSVLFIVMPGIGMCYMLKRIEQKTNERELKAIEKKNGSERRQNVKTLILFAKEERDQITNNNLVPLGMGGFGEVHKGTLSDKTEVAVKASNVVGEATLDEFVKEVEIQSRMTHWNILKLLGCCLRANVPLLLYEYPFKLWRAKSYGWFLTNQKMKHMNLNAMPKGMGLLLTLGTTLFHLAPTLVAAAVSETPPPIPGSAARNGCPSMCGEVNIPYPFGIGDDCAWSGGDNFTVICDHSYIPPRPFYIVFKRPYEIINISVETGEMRIFSSFAYICFSSFNTTKIMHGWHLNYTKSPFLVSPTRNQFTAVGGNTLGFLEGREDFSYYTGCITSSVTLDDAAQEGDDCTGLGCCQTMLAGNLSYVHMFWRNILVRTPINTAWNYSPCGYAFLAEKGWYQFRRRDLVDGNGTFAKRFGESFIPVVLDWAIRNGSCEIPPKIAGVSVEPTASACVSPHSYCVNATQGPGYLCNCSNGFMGNPYVPEGCTNIDECKLRKSDPEKYGKLYPCHSGGTCKDTEGDYICTCGFGLRGDGKSDAGCQLIFPVYSIAILATVVAGLLLALLLWYMHRDRKRRIKVACFDKNGGKILKDAAGINIFTETQLEKITNHYDTLIGEGAFGKVFKGTTDDKQLVAVKRSHKQGKDLGKRNNNNLQQGDDIVNEITFQFGYDHPNLVRLVGCCLETNIPVLVFQFISNGSLENLLHDATHKVLRLRTRLNIAFGSAEALAYIHSKDRIHGDIKSANILLDDKLMPKVSDFGSSKILSVDMYARAVAADMSYIDPLYMKTERFTAKSDVYSFSVVLLELITRKTVKYGKDKMNSLPVDFVKTCKDKGNGRQMYDIDILSQADEGAQCQHCIDCLDKIGDLAVRCLKEDVDERPTMAEVVDELKKATDLVDKCNHQ